MGSRDQALAGYQVKYNGVRRSDGRIAAVGKRMPSFGNRDHLVAMAHPHVNRLFAGETMKEISIVIDGQLRRSVLTLVSLRDIATRSEIDQSHAVANAEKWNREFKNLARNSRSFS